MEIYEVGTNVMFEGDFDVKLFKHKSGAEKYKKWLDDNPKKCSSGYGDTYCVSVDICEDK